MVREERMLKGGFFFGFYSRWTQEIRVLVDKLAKEELSKIPALSDNLKKAIQSGSPEGVAKYEKEFAELFHDELEQLYKIDVDALRMEYREAEEIKKIMDGLHRLKERPELGELREALEELSKELSSITQKARTMYESHGDLIQEIQLRNINIQGQIGAIRSLLTPMVLFARQDREQAQVLNEIGKKIESLEKQLEVEVKEEHIDDVKKSVGELKKLFEEFDKYLEEEFKALFGLQHNIIYLMITVKSHSEAALKQLQALLKEGFDPKVEQQLELTYKKEVDETEGDIATKLMWLEKAGYNELKEVFEKVRTGQAELAKAA